MQFTVITALMRAATKVLDNAVLLVRPDDESQPTVRLSPAFWRQINESHDEPPQPGAAFQFSAR